MDDCDPQLPNMHAVGLSGQPFGAAICVCIATHLSVQQTQVSPIFWKVRCQLVTRAGSCECEVVDHAYRYLAGPGMGGLDPQIVVAGVELPAGVEAILRV